MTKLATQMGKSYLVSSSKISKSCPDDVEEADTACTSCDETPKYLQAIFSGSLADQDCYSCENIPTTYVAEQTSACQWKLNLCNCNSRSPYVPASSITVEIVLEGGDYILRCTVRVRIFTSFTTGPTETAVYEKNFGTTSPDCRSFSGQSLTFQSLSDHDVCGDWSTLSVTVNAVNGPGDDDDRQCPYCIWQSMPDQFTVEISGSLTDVNCDCTDLGGAVTVTQATTTDVACCTWKSVYVGDCTWSYTLTILDGRMDVLVQGPTQSINYQITSLAQPHNCQSSVSVPWLNNTGLVNCAGWSGTTAEVMAV